MQLAFGERSEEMRGILWRLRNNSLMPFGTGVSALSRKSGPSSGFCWKVILEQLPLSPGSI